MKQKTKKRPGLTTVLLSLLFLAGLSLLLYPTISNFWNSIHHFTTIGDYDSQVVQMEHGEYGRLREEAQAYNRDLATLADPHYPPEEMVERYKQTLDVTGNGVMGYVEIPSINCTLPIYHGTDEAVLQIALGHLEWTSLPVGGAGTHSAISGHRGLPSAELLTHIDRLEPGDIFYLHVLDEVLKYRVCDTFVVLPEDTSRLAPVEGKDYLTLVTCTPYGINSHRLLVRGERVLENGAVSGETVYVANEIRPVHLMYVIPVVLTGLVAAAGVVFLIRELRERRRQKLLAERRRRKAERYGEAVWQEDSKDN